MSWRASCNTVRVLRIASVLVLTVVTAQAEPARRVTVGVGGTLESVLAHTLDVSFTIQLSRNFDLNGSISVYGKPRFLDDVEPVDGSIYAGQLGASYVHWEPSYAYGARASLGYQRIRGRDYNWLFDDGRSFPINMDNMFAEAAGIARARIGDRVFVELVPFLRVHRMNEDTAFIVASYAFHEGDFVLGFGATAGLHVAL